jgi:hypothetical protein
MSKCEATGGLPRVEKRKWEEMGKRDFIRMEIN